MPVAVVTEKPAVARDIAAVLGAKRAAQGCLVGNGYVVTWAVGHLVGLAEPGEMDPHWKSWSRGALPMLPRAWKLVVFSQTHEQFDLLKRIINGSDIERVVCATDAGREGELIFRYIYRMAGCKKPVERLWISSLTPEAIQKGFSQLAPAAKFSALANAAEGRSRADWLVGMNLTRAYSLTMGDTLYSVGRVQTPTLAMLVEREQAISSFVPKPYREVVATFGASETEQYTGLWINSPGPEDDTDDLRARLPADTDLAECIRDRCLGKTGRVKSVTGSDKTLPPPFFYDLTELQRHANRLFGFTASKTLSLAQSLYEQHKLISYPRTDSRHLTTDVVAELGAVVRTIASRYEGMVAEGSGQRPLHGRFVNNSKVRDHHAIIPTSVSASGKRLSHDEILLYDLICRRLLMAWHADTKTRFVRVTTEVVSDDACDIFLSRGSQMTQVGWKVLDLHGSSNREPSMGLPDRLAEGQRSVVSQAEILNKETQPPKRFTDATLLSAMETAGKCLDDRELEDAMRERGLGTPATRASILETLIEREYLERNGKSLHATAKGIALIDGVHERVKSPGMTAEWEYALKRMEQGHGSLDEFVSNIERYVTDVVREVLGRSKTPMELEQVPHLPAQCEVVKSADPEQTSAVTASVGPGAPLDQILRARFGYEQFRPHQEDVCMAVSQGRDALLVMPTGSGKSLCYQLPGIARGGTTVVISPLIALMEDQTAKLKAMGFAAERVHSGRSREESREACRAYLQGKLDFLTIAPERLGVPGFPEMLARRPPVLIAIDEAHCISHWGHDFRPDYRLLGERLPLLRGAPVLALTATATTRVQDDILAQLGMTNAGRFIRGFRRDNLGIEVIECQPSQRLPHVLHVLEAPERRPAIVYVPTRKAAEQVAEALSARFRAAPYHAGLSAEARAQTQAGFQSGAIAVVVATVAFGMGIDKSDIRTVVHMALPGTIEGYYQEIGRAGRDGKPSRALLLYSFIDRKMHERFFERDYPGTDSLEELLEAVLPEGIKRTDLLAATDLEADVAEAAVTKLWIHGGITVDDNDVIRVTSKTWQPSYEAIRDHRTMQLGLVFDFARGGGCRMLRLIHHFGETKDRAVCGVCDVCAPTACVARQFREATDFEKLRLQRIAQKLRERDGVATGTLYRQLYPDESVDRSTFEADIDAMARANLVSVVDETFEKEGRSIRFRRVMLMADGYSALETALASVRFSVVEDLRPGVRRRPAREVGATKPKRDRRDAARSTRKGREAEAKKPSPPAQPTNNADPGAVERLRKWRLEVARTKRIPAFRILSDRTLTDIACARPANLEDLLVVRGVGPHMIEHYGLAILGVLRG